MDGTAYLDLMRRAIHLALRLVKSVNEPRRVVNCIGLAQESFVISKRLTA
jgi:hypothetical protein